MASHDEFLFLLQVYYYCSVLKDNVDASSLKKGQKDSVNGLICKRWDYLHSDSHGAALCMDPELWDARLNSEVSFVHSFKVPSH